MSHPDILLCHRSPPENRGGLDAIADELRDRLPEGTLVRASDREETIELLETVPIVVEHRLDQATLVERTGIEWIQSLSSGYDRYDPDTLEDQGVTLTTVSGVHAEPVAQHVLGSILAFERGLFRAHRQGADAAWRRFAPEELTGKTAGIVGVGAIGGRIADRLSALGMRILGVKRDLDDVPSAVDEAYAPGDLHTVLGRADYVVVACPLTAETRGLFDRTAFDSMSPDAVFVNIARGAIADQDDLIAALQTGELGGAILDVTADEPLAPTSPLWSLENVLVTPHMAGGSPLFAERVGAVVEHNYRAFSEGRLDDLRNRVV